MSTFFFSSRRRHTRWPRDWSSDVCSSDLLMWQTELYIVELKLFKTNAFYQTSPTLIRFLNYFLKFFAASMCRQRSEERRVGKECRYRRSADDCRMRGYQVGMSVVSIHNYV